MEKPPKKYKPVMLKTETYKTIKQLTIDLELPLTQVIDLLLKEYRDRHKTI